MGLKIKKITNLTVKEKAYDITVDSKDHTFQLSNGVFVHNSLKIPKNYLGDTDDAGGFDGGTSLSLLSSRYAKTIKRIQNIIIQLVTDLINILLVDKGYSSYINKFNLRMQEPTTREEVDRKDAMINRITVVQDTMSLFDDIQDPVSRLTILKNLLGGVSTDAEILQVLDRNIEALELAAKQQAMATGGDMAAAGIDDSGFADLDVPGGNQFTAEPGGGLDTVDLSDTAVNSTFAPDTGGAGELPTPEALGAGDFTSM